MLLQKHLQMLCIWFWDAFANAFAVGDAFVNAFAVGDAFGVVVDISGNDGDVEPDKWLDVGLIFGTK